MSRKLIILIVIAAVVLGSVVLFGSDGAGTAALWRISREGTWLLPLVGVAALVDSVNPCAFSILLLTIAFLLSIGAVRGRMLAIGASYIAGLFFVYLLIGLGLLQVLHLFDTPHFMAKVGAALLIALGALNLVNALFPKFPVKFRIPHGAHKKLASLMEKASLPTAFLLGGLVGLCEFPCTGGPYLMVVGLLHDSASYLTGVGYLFLYNLIFVLPLVVMLLLGSDEKLLGKVQAWKTKEAKSMRLWSGVAMVALGIIIFFL
mgnify:CR=1 FL=1